MSFAKINTGIGKTATVMCHFFEIGSPTHATKSRNRAGPVSRHLHEVNFISLCFITTITVIVAFGGPNTFRSSIICAL